MEPSHCMNCKLVIADSPKMSFFSHQITYISSRNMELPVESLQVFFMSGCFKTSLDSVLSISSDTSVTTAPVSNLNGTCWFCSNIVVVQYFDSLPPTVQKCTINYLTAMVVFLLERHCNDLFLSHLWHIASRTGHLFPFVGLLCDHILHNEISELFMAILLVHTCLH